VGLTINQKIPIDKLPTWDGGGKTLLDYLDEMDALASDNQFIAIQLARTAHFGFTSAAKSWWQSLPADARRYAQQSWECFVVAIHQHFMNPRWLRERKDEYADMEFRQTGHTSETPKMFFQRRIKYFRRLNPNDPPGLWEEVQSILISAPLEWHIYFARFQTL
jgi:hypothetical protein